LIHAAAALPFQHSARNSGACLPACLLQCSLMDQYLCRLVRFLAFCSLRPEPLSKKRPGPNAEDGLFKYGPGQETDYSISSERWSGPLPGQSAEMGRRVFPIGR
jgi:hypothetical protein